MSAIDEAYLLSDEYWLLLQNAAKPWYLPPELRKNVGFLESTSQRNLCKPQAPQIRELAIQHGFTLESTVLPSAPRSSEIRDDSTNGNSSEYWRQPFRGTVDQVFKNYIDECASEEIQLKEKTLYARHIAVVQSSGTGKSRLANQVSKSIFAVPLCFRQPNSSGYPPRDVEVCDYFTDDLPTTPEAADQRCNSFLLALLVVLREKLENIQSNSQFSSPEELQLAFDEGMATAGHGKFRVRFHSEVVRRAKGFCSSSWRKVDHGPHWQDAICIGSHEEMSLGNMATIVCGLLAKTASRGNEGRCQLLINVDEADYFSLGTDPIYRTYFSHFRKSFSYIVSSPIVILLLSTAAVFRDFMPQTHTEKSARARHENSRFFEPFPHIGWHILAPTLPECSFESLNELVFMKKFGRPLFASWGKNIHDLTLIVFAAGKLLCEHNWESLLSLPSHLRRAVLCSQVFINVRRNSLPQKQFGGYAQQQTNKTIEEDTELERQVRSHLAILRVYDMDSGRLTVQNPVEPVLALASTHFLLHFQIKSRFTLLQIYNDICNDYNMDAGARGELFGMVITLEAYKQAHNIIPVQFPVPSVIELLKPLKLAQYLDHLLDGKNLKLLHADLSKDNPTVRVLQYKEMAEHWTANSNIELLQAYISGVAFKGHQNQYAVDLVISVLFGTQLAEESMGAIMIQVKNVRKLSGEPIIFEQMATLRKRMWPNGSSKVGIHILFSFGSPYKPPVVTYKPGSSTYEIEIYGAGPRTFSRLNHKHIGTPDLYITILSYAAQSVADQFGNLSDQYDIRKKFFGQLDSGTDLDAGARSMDIAKGN